MCMCVCVYENKCMCVCMRVIKRDSDERKREKVVVQRAAVGVYCVYG